MDRRLGFLWGGGALGFALLLGLCASQPRGALLASAEQRRAVAPPPLPSTPALVEGEELWAHPGRHLGRELVLRVQFDDWIGSWNPFVTRFGPGEYHAFTAWSEGQFPWRAADFERPLTRLFVRRGSAADWALEPARRHQAFELHVAVRAVFDDVPWIEVLGVRPLVRSIPEGSVLHATRALELMGRRAWERADAELARAQAAPLHDRAREELDRLRAICKEELDALEARPLLRRAR